MPELSGRQFSGPQYEQLSFPGMGRETEQMRLFETHRAGPANVYARNPSGDASQWRDEDREVALTEDEHRVVNPSEEDYEYEISPNEMQGEFFEFESPPGSTERQYLANMGAHTRTLGETREAGTYLGHDAYPKQVRPELTFDDLSEEFADYDQRTWVTDEGTQVGRITYHEDEWGPNVNYAEINPMYRGRGFSRDALTKVAGGLEPGEGIMHAGSFTQAGHGAFQAKGVPTEDDIERGFQDWVSSQDLDEDEVLAEAEVRYPDEDWRSPDAPTGYLDWIRSDLSAEKYEDPDMRSQFRSNLEDLQSQVLSQLPGSRKSAFIEGWKPKGPTRGKQEELEGMPQKYTGAFEG